MIHAICCEIIDKDCALPQSEIFYPTLPCVAQEPIPDVLENLEISLSEDISPYQTLTHIMSHFAQTNVLNLIYIWMSERPLSVKIYIFQFE